MLGPEDLEEEASEETKKKSLLQLVLERGEPELFYADLEEEASEEQEESEDKATKNH